MLNYQRVIQIDMDFSSFPWLSTDGNPGGAARPWAVGAAAT